MFNQQRLLAFSMFGVVAGMWLIADPYYGIWHDAVLYTVQALRRLHPDVYRLDLFFRFSSQDDFTLFPAAHAWLIALFGIDRAALVLTIAGKLVWLAALVYFASAYLRGFHLWLGLVVVATYPALFDSHNVFSYGESFATPRIFAEALTLLAMGLMLRGRTWSALAVQLVAMLLHPLVALPGLALLALLVRHMRKSVVLLAIAGSAAVCLLGVLGLEPFARLFTRFDPVWLDVVEKRNVYVFLHHWRPQAFGRLAFIAAVLLAARAACGKETAGRVAERLLLLGIACLLTAWFGATVFQNVLITQLQVWRGFWLMQLGALSLMGAITSRLWNSHAADRILLLGLWSALLLRGVSAGVLAVASVSIWLALKHLAPNWQPTRLIWGVLSLFPIGAAAFTIMDWQASMVIWDMFYSRPKWQVVVGDPLPAALLTAGLAWLGRRARGAWVAALAGGFVLVLGLAAWDVRRPEHMAWDAGAAAAQPAQAVIPAGATVFWPDGLWPTWLWLQRSHYASSLQTAGVLFSRDTSQLAERRQSRLRALGFNDGNAYWDWSSTEPERKVPVKYDMKEARALCEDPDLDYVVFPTQKGNKAMLTFVFPFIKKREAKLDLFECRRLRDAASLGKRSG